MKYYNWRDVTVSEVAKIFLGGTPSRSVPEYWGGGVKWATAKDVASCSTRYLKETQETISWSGIENSAAKVLDRNTIVITARGTVGAICMIGEPMAFNQTCYGLVANEDTDPNYLYYILKASLGQLSMLSYGTVFNTITMNTFHALKIPHPPLPEQRAIAAILGSLDDKIELNRRMNETLEDMARAIFKSWFVDFDPVRAKMEGRQPSGMDAETAALFPDSFEDSPIGKIPKEWKVARLTDIVNINPRRILPRGQIAPYLDMQNMPIYNHRPDVWIKRPFGSGTKFMNGDTLLARITPCLENGKTAFVDFLEEGQVGWGSTEYIVFRPKPSLPVEYGYYLARSEELRTYAIQNMTGSSGRQRVPAECFTSYSIVVPPKAIAQCFGDIAKSLMNMIRANSNQSITLTAIRDTLLPKLLSGEIRVKDTEKFVR